MKLEENKEYDRQQLAEWFGIGIRTFSNRKEEKLQELSDYCSYTLNTTPKGNFKSVIVNEVYCDTFLKEQGKELIKWLKAADRWAETADQGVSSCAIVTNYYCKTNNIEYDGPHYIWMEVKGRSEETGEKVKQQKKKPNPEFATWHYLYHKVSRYYQELNNRSDNIKYDLSTGEWNPTKAILTTEEMKARRHAIHQKYYPGDIYEDAIEMADYVNAADAVMIPVAELQKLNLIINMSNQERRTVIANEQLAEGVLKRDGVKRDEA